MRVELITVTPPLAATEYTIEDQLRHIDQMIDDQFAVRTHLTLREDLPRRCQVDKIISNLVAAKVELRMLDENRTRIREQRFDEAYLIHPQQANV